MDYNPKPCPCGSGELRAAQYDGHGIFLTFTCIKCHEERMSGFRADIHERYECDEPIDED
jgi:cbb3-type cytochrome oxidase cytochrome c subunit